MKAEMRESNSEYLKTHPEIKRMLNIFMIDLLNDQPVDVVSFTGNFFGRDHLKDFISS